jgi:O-antigen/teichoic acid export membrane protein
MHTINIFGFSLKATLKSARVRQAGVLYIALVMSLILGIAVSVINTRLLGPKAFGDFKLLQTVWTVGVLFVTFGLLTTGGNLLAEKKSRDAEKPLLGSLLVITAIISLIFSVMMIVASFSLGHLYGDEFGQKIRLYAGLLFVFPFQIYLQETLRGTNDIHSLAFLNALPQFIYIPASLAMNCIYGFSLDLAILVYLLSIALTVLLIVIWTKPNFSRIGAGVREVLEKNIALGSHIYIATLLSTTTAYLGQFTLGYFKDTQQVGEFALALTITMPLTMIPNAIATTFFKHFAGVNRIPTKVIVAATGLSVVTLAGFLLVIKVVIIFLYTERFSDVVPLAYICAVGSVIHGIGDVYNRYLLAHGKTSLLRSNAMHLAVVSALGYVFLVVAYGAMGAALTKLIVGMLYMTAMFIYYRNTI